MQSLKFFMEVQRLVGRSYSTKKLVMCTGLTCQGIEPMVKPYATLGHKHAFIVYERLAKGRCPE